MSSLLDRSRMNRVTFNFGEGESGNVVSVEVSRGGTVTSSHSDSSDFRSRHSADSNKIKELITNEIVNQKAQSGD